jgi:hypothetical protein
MEDRVTIDLREGVADVRLMRADKMNALDDAMFAALVATGEKLKSPASSAARADPRQALTTHPPSRRQTSRGTNRRSISGSRTQWATSMARGWFSSFLTPQIVRSSLRIWRL